MKYVLAAVFLCGCAANPELERQQALHGPHCERLGLLSGTEGYGNWVMWQSMVDDEQRKSPGWRK